MRVLVVGAGIASTLVARELRRRAVEVVVLDHSTHASASRAAAGLVNPVIGIRLTLVPDVSRLLTAAVEAFTGLTGLLGRSLWHPLPIERFFRDSGERERWVRRAGDPAYADWTEAMPEEGTGWAALGGVRIRGGGWFDYTGLSEVLDREGIPVVHGLVDPGALETSTDGVRWNGERFDALVLCPGYGAGLGDPWFSGLPWKPARGEILTLHSHQGPVGAVWMRGVFVIPLGDGVYRVGSTYRWDAFDTGPTIEAREEILAGWRALGLPSEVEILDHRVGVRPILQDRMPVVGRHPGHRAVWTLNGLGSRGAMMAPLLARQLVEALLDQREIDPPYRLGRFAVL